MSELHRKAAQVVVIATAESKQKVHLELLQSKGEHVFENFLEIAPPSLVRVSHIPGFSNRICLIAWEL